MKTFKSLTKSALDTQSLLYLNATEKNALLLQSIPRMINEIIQNKWNKNTTQRKKEVQTSLLNLVQFCGCIIFTSPKKPTPYDTAPAVLLFCPRCISITPQNYGEAQINNMLLVYTRSWKYKIETVHVQHAGLIFNADFFVSIYIRI